MSARILIAKTSLDGHWRGVAVVAAGLRDAGFEVILGGMLRPSEIATIARDEDVQLIGLNVGGRVDVVERVLNELRESGVENTPVFVGGTISPRDAARLRAAGVDVFPPGSSMVDIVATARRLTSVEDLS